MDERVFRKRRGATNKGFDYEIINIASLVLRLINDQQIENFFISASDEDFGAFDDIVVELVTNDRTEMYGLQLKHSEKVFLNVNMLTGRNGKFSLNKYFDSYQSSRFRGEFDSILCTNLRIRIEKNRVYRIDNEDIQFTMSRCYLENKLKISKEINHCYKFQVVENSSAPTNNERMEQYKTFFKHFFLYAGQENVDRLRATTKNKFQEMFKADKGEFDKYLKMINEWNMQEGREEKLNKKWMQDTIALNLLFSRICPLSFRRGVVNEGRRVLREAISSFHVTEVGENAYDAVKTFWEDDDFENIDVAVLGRTLQKYFVISKILRDDNLESITNDEKLKSVFLWLVGTCPLIVARRDESDETLDKAMQLCPEKSFILLKK